VRYRGGALAELFRALGALRTLQADTPGLLEAGPQQPGGDLPSPASLPNEPEKAA
jgi:hypothetical protein